MPAARKQSLARPKRARTLLLAALLAAASAQAEPDEELLGKSAGYPAGGPATWYLPAHRVGAWSAMDRVGLPVRAVPRGDTVLPMPPAAAAPAIRYRWRNLDHSLDEYLARRRVTGLLILKNGEIVAEHYRYGRTPEARFLSFSMAKSVTSLLVGIAHDKGLIASLDDPAAKYVKELEGSAYGAATVRQLLRMSSGIRFTERYDGNDDVARLSRAIAGTSGPRPLALLRTFDERLAHAGEKFAYATAETEVLGRVLTGATGRSMAELTSEWLWKPMGAERDAFWRVGADGQEQAGGGFNATLRDWGRLGVLLAGDGTVNGRVVVPRDYLLDATDAARQPPAFAPYRATPFFGYGYQFWLYPLKTRTLTLQGIHGQTLYVQPASGIVMVQTAVYDQASGRTDPEPHAERDALWRGVLATLGGSTD